MICGLLLVFFYPCRFGRTIAGSNVPNEDLRLDEPHFIIFGVGLSNPSPTSLSIHQTGVGNPMISTTMINPSTATVSIGADPSCTSSVATN